MSLQDVIDKIVQADASKVVMDAKEHVKEIAQEDVLALAEVVARVHAQKIVEVIVATHVLVLVKLLVLMVVIQAVKVLPTLIIENW